MPAESQAPAPLLVDRREAARLLGVSPGSIENLRLRGALPSVKIGARRLYDVADLRAFIEAQKRKPPYPPRQRDDATPSP
ncbi:Helix-turn-helix domain protein [Phycisphaerae bacterium RAS1]|nr:Helix-turn-helix domain protein [Phycisphaerae bacterium RAS1]